MNNEWFELGTQPIPKREPPSFDRDDYTTPISEKYIIALQEYFGLTREEVFKKGETADAYVFDDKFTPEVIEDDEAIKKLYASTPYFAFRNPIYYINREFDAFQPFWKPIVAKPGSVIDHGGGAGVFLEVLLRKGITDLTYTDIPGPMFEFVKWFFGDKVKYEEDPDNLNGQYDYITSNSVLEHIPDPVKTVLMFEKHLKPGGQIIVSMARDIHGQHLKKAIDRYDEVINLVSEINKKSAEYYELQINGSAWTTQNAHYQEMLKEGMDWMIADLQDKPTSILDLGCGDGWGTEYLRKQLPSLETLIVGGDIDKAKLEAARKRGLIVEYQDMHSVTDRWSIIFCSHTLEHSHDIRKALGSILDALEIGGKLYLIVPIEQNDPRQYNPSHTQWINSPAMIRSEIIDYPGMEIVWETEKTRDTLEYWVIAKRISRRIK